MILCDRSISNSLKCGEIQVVNRKFTSDIIRDQVKPNSLDIHLDNRITDKHGKLVDDASDNYDSKIHIEPLQFVLGTTREYIKLPNNICALMFTRSSIGRQGIFTENAGHIDAGFEGELTFELFNASNEIVELDPEIPVAQLIFFRLDGDSKGYNGVYKGQVGATPSKYIKER